MDSVVAWIKNTAVTLKHYESQLANVKALMEHPIVPKQDKLFNGRDWAFCSPALDKPAEKLFRLQEWLEWENRREQDLLF